MGKNVEAFQVRKNVLSDSSVIWEIWQRGSDQRLASTDDEIKATTLAINLNDTLLVFELTDNQNTVDA